MASRLLCSVHHLVRPIGQVQQSKQLLCLANQRPVGVAFARAMSEIGRGEGKGGGSGGSIKSSGGSMGKRTHVQEEEYFRKKQSESLRRLQEDLNVMRQGKVEYHQAQYRRHMAQIEEHQKLMASDKDPSHNVYIDSHKEAAAAHQQYLEKLKKVM